jgi:hypothetical protein
VLFVSRSLVANRFIKKRAPWDTSGAPLGAAAPTLGATGLEARTEPLRQNRYAVRDHNLLSSYNYRRHKSSVQKFTQRSASWIVKPGNIVRNGFIIVAHVSHADSCNHDLNLSSSL